MGIISDSYTIATDYVGEKLNFDFSESNILELDQNGNSRGEGRCVNKRGRSCYCHAIYIDIF